MDNKLICVKEKKKLSQPQTLIFLLIRAGAQGQEVLGVETQEVLDQSRQTTSREGQLRGVCVGGEGLLPNVDTSVEVRVLFPFLSGLTYRSVRHKLYFCTLCGRKNNHHHGYHVLYVVNMTVLNLAYKLFSLKKREYIRLPFKIYAFHAILCCCL